MVGHVARHPQDCSGLLRGAATGLATLSIGTMIGPALAAIIGDASAHSLALAVLEAVVALVAASWTTTFWIHRSMIRTLLDAACMMATFWMHHS